MNAPVRRTVLFVIPSLGGGGAERVVLTLVRNLDRARYRILLAVVDGEPQTLRAEVAPDIELIDLGERRVRQALTKLVRLAWRERPDVIFTVIGHLNAALGLIRPLLPRGTRVIARETTVFRETLPLMSHPRLWRLAFRWLYPRLDRIVCQSLAMQRELVDDMGVPEAKTVVIRNPVDFERIARLAREPLPAHARPSGPWLVAAGRLVPEKGFDVLIDALSLLPAPRPVVTILGEGAERGALQRLVEQRGLSETVRFAGFQPNPYPWVAAADAFVMCSRFEPFANTVLDALACGTPVIAVPAPGGLGELLPGPAGSVVAAAATPAALAESIASFPYDAPRTGAPRATLAPYEVSAVLAGYNALFNPAGTADT